MGSDVVLSAGVRQNLLSLQYTAQSDEHHAEPACHRQEGQLGARQPGQLLHVARACTSRAKDLSALLDSMANGIKTIEAADNGITSIKKTIEVDEVDAAAGAAGQVVQDHAYTVDATTPARRRQTSRSRAAPSARTPVNVDAGHSTRPDDARATRLRRATGAPALPSRTTGVNGTVDITLTNGDNRRCAGDQDQQRHPGAADTADTANSTSTSSPRNDARQVKLTSAKSAARLTGALPVDHQRCGSTSTDGRLSARHRSSVPRRSTSSSPRSTPTPA